MSISISCASLVVVCALLFTDSKHIQQGDDLTFEAPTVVLLLSTLLESLGEL